jgi:hypothetical protein
METEHGTLRPRLVPVADLTPENLGLMIKDMEAEPGWYTSAHLYAWYTGMAREAELEPVSQKKFGMVLKALGFRASTRRVDGANARCWFLPRHAIRAAQGAAQ